MSGGPGSENSVGVGTSGANPVSGISIRRIATGRMIVSGSASAASRSGQQSASTGLGLTVSGNGEDGGRAPAPANFSRGTGVLAMPLPPLSPAGPRPSVTIEPLPAHSVLGRGAGVY